MILGVDGLRLIGRRAGVGRALEAVLASMATVDHPFREIRVYTPEPLPTDVRLPPTATNVVFGARLPRTVWQQFALSRRHGTSGLLLCPSYVVPLAARSPTFLIHHGSYEGYPRAFPWWRRTKARWINAASARRATALTTVSEHSKRDIVRFYGVAPESIDVVPEGVDTGLFRPRSGEDLGVRAWRRRLAHDDPYVLYVGSPSPRRNVDALLRAFAALRADGRLRHRLVLIGTALPGMPLGGLIEALGIGDVVDAIDYANHGELAFAYNAADLLVYPSSYEGFGMPVLEAMASGLPAIALDRAAFPEFAGGVALLLPDAGIDTLRKGIATGLGDENWRQHARHAGPRRAADYDWRRITARYVELMVRAARVDSR